MADLPAAERDVLSHAKAGNDLRYGGSIFRTFRLPRHVKYDGLAQTTLRTVPTFLATRLKSLRLAAAVSDVDMILCRVQAAIATHHPRFDVRMFF